MASPLPNLAEIIEQAPDGVIIVDGDGAIAYANARVSELFGFMPAEIAGRSIELLIPERFRQRHVNHRGDYAQDSRVRLMGAVDLPLFARRKDGSEFPVDIHLAPLLRDDQRRTLAFIRDATERHAIFEELKRSRQAAKDLAQVKGEFLSLAAHDLSQPIQTLELVCSTMEKNAEPSSQFAQLASLASSSLVRMRELLKMLLDISRVESGTIQVAEEPVRIADIFSDLERQFAPIARAKGLQFRAQPCARIIVTDPKLLRGMLSNLVTNATRYTANGEIRIDCTLSSDGRARLAVHDTGIGIPRAHLRTIFEDFYRGVEAKHLHQDGFGLGLGIVRRLSQLLEIPVTVESEIGRGSIFTIEIPSHKVFPISEDIPS